MISTKPTKLTSFNRIEGYEPINVKSVVSYLRKHTGKTKLTIDNGYYDTYRVPFQALSIKGLQGNVELMIDSTIPNYGGLRYWLVCSYCQHKTVNLYYINDAVACRHCFNLQYSSKTYRGNSTLVSFTSYEKAIKIWATRRMCYAKQPTRAGRRVNRLFAKMDDSFFNTI